METLSLNCEELTHMTAELKIGGKIARILLDTGIVGTNLMSLNWAQSNQIQTTKIVNPVEITIATKNSRAMANYSAKADIDIGYGKRISCNFLLLPISSNNVILGMPFMVKANVILRPGSGNATFGNSNTTIKYAAIGGITTAIPITIIPQVVDKETQNTEIT